MKKIRSDFIDLTGQRFGMLLITGFDGSYHYHKGFKSTAKFKYRCDCGSIGYVTRGSLFKPIKPQTNCGCVERERLHEPKKQFRLRLPFGEYAKRTVLLHYRSAARRVGRTWALSDEQFYQIVTSNCYYCGCPPSNKLDKGKFSGFYIYSGIDRIVNSLGYEPTNVLPCCKVCNHAKHTMSHDDFIAWATRVANHNRQPIQAVA